MLRSVTGYINSDQIRATKIKKEINTLNIKIKLYNTDHIGNITFLKWKTHEFRRNS
jgi:hypothetical protein